MTFEKDLGPTGALLLIVIPRPGRHVRVRGKRGPDSCF